MLCCAIMPIMSVVVSVCGVSLLDHRTFPCAQDATRKMLAGLSFSHGHLSAVSSWDSNMIRRKMRIVSFDPVVQNDNRTSCFPREAKKE